MQIRLGCALHIDCPVATPALALVHPHSSRRDHVIDAERLHLAPERTTEVLVDRDGNRWCRFLAAAGATTLSYGTTLTDPGEPDPVVPRARACAVQALPIESYRYLNPSRYCDSDNEVLLGLAWNAFGAIPPGWGQVEAIGSWVHAHLSYDKASASPMRTAGDALLGGVGVCRDYAHLGIALCRALNIPARYCSGYLPAGAGDDGHHPLDFTAWFEAWLEDRWYVFDPRHNVPRAGRVLIGRGRDAADVPFLRTFGAHRLKNFEVITELHAEAGAPLPSGT